MLADSGKFSTSHFVLVTMTMGFSVDGLWRFCEIRHEWVYYTEFLGGAALHLINMNVCS